VLVVTMSLKNLTFQVIHDLFTPAPHIRFATRLEFMSAARSYIIDVLVGDPYLNFDLSGGAYEAGFNAGGGQLGTLMNGAAPHIFTNAVLTALWPDWTAANLDTYSTVDITTAAGVTAFWNNDTPAYSMTICFLQFIISHRPDEVCLASHTGYVTTAILAMSEQGTISDRKLATILKDIQDISGLRMGKGNVSPKVMETLHKNLYSQFSIAEMANFMRLAYEFLPRIYLRLRMALERSAGKHLTRFTAIQSVIQNNSYVPLWYADRVMGTNELDAFYRAAAEINDNPFFGYRPDLATVKSASYKNIASIAMHFMFDAQIQISYEDYRGLVPKDALPNSLQATAVINSFVDLVIRRLPQGNTLPDGTAILANNDFQTAQAEYANQRTRLAGWRSVTPL